MGRELCQAVNSKEHQKKQMLQVDIVSDTLAAARATTAATAALWHCRTPVSCSVAAKPNHGANFM